jgi:hypothetical protein
MEYAILGVALVAAAAVVAVGAGEVVSNLLHQILAGVFH